MLGLYSSAMRFFLSVLVVSSVVKNPDAPKTLASPSRPLDHLNIQNQRLPRPALPSALSLLKASSLHAGSVSFGYEVLLIRAGRVIRG
jgi:hypothetical protein